MSCGENHWGFSRCGRLADLLHRLFSGPETLIRAVSLRGIVGWGEKAPFTYREISMKLVG